MNTLKTLILALIVTACGQESDQRPTEPAMCKMTGFSLVAPADSVEIDGVIYVPCDSQYAAK